MKIKIMHILHSLQIGGLENGVVNIVNLLSREKFEHIICCVKSSGPMADKIIFKDIQIYELHKNGKDYFMPLRLMKLIRLVKPDLVHTRNWAAIDGVIGARLAGVKNIIHSEHGREVTDPSGRNKLRKTVRKILSPYVSIFVVVSAELRNWLIDDVGIPESKIIQIINGVDIEKYSIPDDKKFSKSQLGFDPDSFMIGTVGRLDPVKDYQTLIRAFTLLANVSVNTIMTNKIKLLIIGFGPEEQKLKTLAEEYKIIDKIFFLGKRFDIPRLLHSMDVFVLPSVAEGISNTVLEAMASGLPVIATKIGGNVELVEHSQTGFLFTPGNYKELADMLVIYLRNSSLLREHGSMGRLRIKEKFSLTTMIQKYEELYSSLTC